MTDQAAAMTDHPAAPVRRSLAALELASGRYRGDVRQRLSVSEEELSALLFLAHHGSVPQRHLAEVTTLSRSGAGAMIQRLEHDGFVERHTQPSDRRLRLVELSATGRQRMTRAYGELDAAVERSLADRSPGELEALARLLDALAEATLAAGGGEDCGSPPSVAAGDPIWRRWG
jgi:DNA-binding MarR family transcriptional regulator